MDPAEWYQQHSVPAAGSDGDLKAMRAVELPKSTEIQEPPDSLKRHSQEHLAAEITPVLEIRKPPSFWLSLHDDSMVSGCCVTSTMCQNDECRGREAVNDTIRRFVCGIRFFLFLPIFASIRVE